MRWRDILGLAISALWQQKVRTALTLLGVLFGAFVLAASLAIGQGVQNAIAKYARQNEVLRRVEVFPEWRQTGSNESTTRPTTVPGEMGDARRQRLRRAINKRQAAVSGRDRTTLSEETLGKLAALPHVESVIPLPWLGGFGVLGNVSQEVEINAARPADAEIGKRLLAGRSFERVDEPSVIVSEFLLYRMGILDEKKLQAVLGQKLRLEFRPQWDQPGFALFVVHPKGGEPTREEVTALDKIRQQLPKALEKLDLNPMEIGLLRKAVADAPTTQPAVYSSEFTIVGIMRLPSEEEEQAPWDPFRLDSDVALPYMTAAQLFFKASAQRDQGIGRAVLVVDHDENVKGVVGAMRKMGLQGHAPLEFIEKQRLLYLFIFGSMTCVAAVAMIVAALGITNTMLISVLERTREIGIMKALGARSGHLQAIFLVEGALIGMIGGSLGLLFAWASSFPGDAWVRQIASARLDQKIDQSIFVFPAWLQIAVISSATLVTVVAAVYPARRAARLDPVTALRHE